MKTPIAKALFLSSALFALSHAGAQLEILNVQVGSGVTYTGRGADPNDTGTTWNNLQVIGQTASAGFIADQNGNEAVGVYALISSTQPTNTFYDLGDAAGHLFEGYAYLQPTAVATYTIAGLDAYDGDKFSIYLIGGQASTHGQNRDVYFTLDAANGGGSAIAYGSGDPGQNDTTYPYTEGEEYVELTGAVVDGTITGTAAVPAGSGDPEGDFNGFQLELEVPEPGTYALMGLGFALLLVATRKRRSLPS